LVGRAHPSTGGDRGTDRRGGPIARRPHPHRGLGRERARLPEGRGLVRQPIRPADRC